MEQVVISLTPAGIKSVCHASQYDIGRVIRFNLIDGGTPYTLDGTEVIKITIRKPSGAVVERSVPNTVSTYVDWTTADGDCDEVGKCECEFVITKNSVVIGSRNFTMKVEADAYGADVVVETAGPSPVASFETNIVDLFVEIKCSVNAIQEGTPWIDSNVIEKEPYNFRKVAGTASRIGNHLFDKLVGGTVAWNQKIKNGNFANTNDWGANVIQTFSVSNNVATLNVSTISSGIYQNSNFIVGHIYLWSVDIINGGKIQVGSGAFGSRMYIDSASQTFRRFGRIGVAGLDSAVFVVYANEDLEQTIQVKNYVCFDLTAMFGSTIADYIYSLEQATAGSGVNFFRKLFPKDYYAYNAGELISVKTSEHKTTGKNLLPPCNITGSGSIAITTNNGEYTISGTASGYLQFIATNTIKLPAGNYALKNFENTDTHLEFQIRSTDGLTVYAASSTGIGTFTLDKPTELKARIVIATTSTITINQTIKPQLELGSQATAYEPYTEHNYALDDVDLRGLFKLDSNNKLYADGDTYESSGDVGRRFALLDLGTVDYVVEATGQSGKYRYRFSSSVDAVDSDTSKVHSISKLELLRQAGTYDADKDGYTIVGGVFYVFLSAYSNSADPSAVKAALSGVYLLYEKTTPTTEQADPFTNPQEVDEYGTEEYVDNRPVAIPVGHETYYADIYDITGFTACKVSVKDGSNVERKSATIQFGQTVYGGYLEFKNGAWVFTGMKKIMSGSIVVRNVGHSSAANTEYADIYYTDNGIDDTITINSESISNIAEQINSSETGAENKYKVFANAITLYNKNFTSVAKAESILNGSQFVVTLTTPFTLTLTGAQLETLLGENRVSHNCNGDTEVKYLEQEA